MKIAVFDPSIGTGNLGDQIIADAIYEEISNLFRSTQVLKIALNQPLAIKQVRLLKESDLILVGGSNMLNLQIWPSITRRGRWPISILDSRAIQGSILMGVGWSSPTHKPNLAGRWFYKKTLSKTALHSVRDEYTRKKLFDEGIKNTLNTSCPTLWGIDRPLVSKIPSQKSDIVVMTLTDYWKNPELDKKFIGILKDEYKKVFFWPQGFNDITYLTELGVKGVQLILGDLKSYNDFLDETPYVDYVGTRLHGGIRALQKMKRVLIIAVDHRAREISRDINLNVLDRQRLEELRALIHTPHVAELNIPYHAIDEWRHRIRGFAAGRRG